ncbi:MAG: ABC transporter substrate-binding protein [Candidatus Thorarchaeota archaeon]|jgi:peptide/nickel transport system substrate-binding protein
MVEGEAIDSSNACPRIPTLLKRGGLSMNTDRRDVIVAVGLITVLFIPAISTSMFWGLSNFPLTDFQNTLVYTTRGGRVFSLEPAIADDPIEMMVLSNCYDTLVSYDRESVDSFRPLLVTEVPSLENGRISPDGLTYRFTIRSDSPLTPEDVEYSFERVMRRKDSTWDAFLSWRHYWHSDMLPEILLGTDWRDRNVTFEDIDNTVEVEGNDVVFHLAKIYPPFMHILASSSSSILSKAWCIMQGDWPGTEATWEEWSNERSPFRYKTHGFGPFTVSRDFNDHTFRTEREIVLVRNDNYWRGPARLERVVIRGVNLDLGASYIFGDWETGRQMFLEGNADICGAPFQANYGGPIRETVDYSEFEGVEGIRVYTGLPTQELSVMYFNFAAADTSPYFGSGELDGNGVPPDFFRDIDIRKAFAYSIDYDTIINEMYAGEALHPASPVLEWVPHHNPDQERYFYDLDKARQHFQQAWGGEVWNKGFNLTLVTNPWVHPELDRMVAESIKNSAETINTKFHVTVLYIVAGGFFGWEAEGSLPVSFGCSFGAFPWGPAIPDPNTYFMSALDGGYNSTIDSLIEAGMNTLDSAERQAIYYELQRIYHEDVPSIPLFQPLVRHYQRDWVWGSYHNPVAGMDFYEMCKGTFQDATRNIVAHVADLVDSGVLGDDAGNSLTSILDSAIHLMDNGTLSGASHQLNDFIDHVNTLDLPVWDEEELIALAQEIIEVLLTSPSGILLPRNISLTNIELAVGFTIATIALLSVPAIKMVRAMRRE